MISLVKIKNYLLYAFIMGFIFLISCTKEDPEPDPDVNNINNNGGDHLDENDDPINTDVDPDKITNSLLLKNGSVISGNIPDFIQLADLKIDTDTIFWINGIIKRIRIKKPLNIVVGSFSAQIEGSDSYIKAKFEEEEETDTTSVFIFNFDDTDWDPPFSFNIKFVLEDENGTPLDDFDIPVEIEATNNGNCDINPANYWQWIYTIQNGDFISAPGYPRITQASVNGCCIEGESIYSGANSICPFDEHRSVDFETVFMVEHDFLLLNPDGIADGGMVQFTQNLNAGGTDFCSGAPSYNISNTDNSYTSNYTFNPGSCTIIIDGFEGQSEGIYDSDGNYYGEAPLPIYAGSGPNVEYKLLSKHFIKESRNIEGILERVYEAEYEELGWVD